MQFYNPFKPHLVEGGGKWRIRKLSVFWFGWAYKDADGDHYWWSGNYDDWIDFPSKEKAQLVLDRMRMKRIKEGS